MVVDLSVLGDHTVRRKCLLGGTILQASSWVEALRHGSVWSGERLDIPHVSVNSTAGSPLVPLSFLSVPFDVFKSMTDGFCSGRRRKQWIPFHPDVLQEE